MVTIIRDRIRDLIERKDARTDPRRRRRHEDMRGATDRTRDRGRRRCSSKRSTEASTRVSPVTRPRHFLAVVLAAVSLVAPAAGLRTESRRTAGSDRSTSEGGCADRSHWLLGVRGHRRLAIPHGHAGEGDYRGRPDDSGSREAWRTPGIGCRRSRRRISASRTARRPSCASRPASDQLAGRQHVACVETVTQAHERGCFASRMTRPAKGGERSWQGTSVARWGCPPWPWSRSERAPAPKGGSLKVVTTQACCAGYLRKNGVP